jgi:hypothetical protein
MKKVYMVLKIDFGLLKVVAEHESISDCNEYFKDKRYRVIDAWREGVTEL